MAAESPHPSEGGCVQAGPPYSGAERWSLGRMDTGACGASGSLDKAEHIPW